MLQTLVVYFALVTPTFEQTQYRTPPPLNSIYVPFCCFLLLCFYYFYGHIEHSTQGMAKRNDGSQDLLFFRKERASPSWMELTDDVIAINCWLEHEAGASIR
jgi:hypothetical protein